MMPGNKCPSTRQMEAIVNVFAEIVASCTDVNALYCFSFQLLQ